LLAQQENNRERQNDSRHKNNNDVEPHSKVGKPSQTLQSADLTEKEAGKHEDDLGNNDCRQN